MSSGVLVGFLYSCFFVKTGSTSGFYEEAAVQEPDENARAQLLEAAILSNSIWNCRELHSYYVKHMPTPQEACKDKLKPTYGHSCGSLTIDNFDGFYTCTSSRFIMEPDTGPYITYTYAEVDAMIRKLYREKKLN